MATRFAEYPRCRRSGATRAKVRGEQMPEFSYVGEEDQFDTQGLGPAAPEQVQPL